MSTHLILIAFYSIYSILQQPVRNTGVVISCVTLYCSTSNIFQELDLNWATSALLQPMFLQNVIKNIFLYKFGEMI